MVEVSVAMAHVTSSIGSVVLYSPQSDHVLRKQAHVQEIKSLT